MAWIAVAILGSAAIGAGGSIFGGYEQSKATEAASQNIASGQQNALSALMKYLGPYASIGPQVLPTLMSLLTPGPNQNATLSALPGFQFLQNWGQKGVAAQATTRGLGGNALAAGAQYGTGLASTYWDKLVGNLQTLLGTGASAGSALGSGSSNIFTGGAQSQAQLAQGMGGIMAGAAGGAAGAAGNALNSYAGLQMLKNLAGGGGMNSGGPIPVGNLNAGVPGVVTPPIQELE